MPLIVMSSQDQLRIKSETRDMQVIRGICFAAGPSVLFWLTLILILQLHQ